VREDVSGLQGGEVRPREGVSSLREGEVRPREDIFWSRGGEENRFLKDFWSERRGIGLFLVLLQRRQGLYGDIRVKDTVKQALYTYISSA